jgi:polysaccharide biosynthesis/export protein
MKSKLFLSFVVVSCLIVAPAQAEGSKTTPSASAIVAPADTTYLVQPGDILQITVWKEKDLEREVLVRPDGGLSFPLAGEIPATGLTMDGLRKEIELRLTRYIPNPVVTVAVKQAMGNKIYVVGRVNRPGEFTATRYLDVMQALSLAGGTTPYAAENSIKILRRVNGEETAIPFKYGQVEGGRRLKQNIILQSGDVVVVP